MSLPYENATSGKGALAEAQKILQTFGASSFGVMEQFDRGEVIVQFQWRARRVMIGASFKGYAAAWLRHHPYSARYHRMSKVEYEQRALRQGQIAVYSILRDWIKGQITAVEVGMLSFEGAFLGQIMLPTGQTVLEHITSENILALPASESR